MSEFKAKVDRMTSAADGVQTIEKELRFYPGRVTDTVNALKRNKTIAFSPVYGKLRAIKDDVLEQAAKMDSLEKALRYIADEYASSERRNLDLLGSGSWDRHSSMSGEVDKGLESYFQRFWEWIKKLFHWGEKPEESPAEITRQQEKEHDLYMQSEIFSLLETPAYSKETWNKASIEERKEILNRYLADLAKIYGVQVSSKVRFFEAAQTTRGTYTHSRREVSINENYLGRSDSYQIMQTMIHEMRHAYQHSAVDDPDSYQVSPETIRQWKDNFSNYKSTSDGKTTYSEYVSQPVEYDAKNFAKQYSDLSKAKPQYTGSWDEGGK